MLIYFKHFRRSSYKNPRGFTLIELIVVSAIIILITTFILFQQSKFNSSTLLRSLTYSMALSVRQAQVYGTSVRGFTPAAGGSATFGSGYGIHFPAGATPYQYYLFADAASPNDNGQRAADGSEDAVPPSPFILGKGYSLSRLCVRVGQSTPDCSVSSITVFFRRPNPEACISSSAAPTACAPGVPPVYSSAYIEIKSSGNNDTRSVKVVTSGQIAICKPNLADLTQC